MKATAVKFYVCNIHNDLSQLVNARQAISRGSGDYGVNYMFVETNKKDFLKHIEANDRVCCIQIRSNKFIEVDKENISNFII